MSWAGHVLHVTVVAVGLNYASRVFMPVRASWGSCFAAAILTSIVLAVLAFGVLIHPSMLVFERMGGAPWFLLSVGVCALAAMALLHGEDRRGRPTWPAAFGIGALVQTALSLIRVASGIIQKVGA